jgi:hypothetical protein
MKKMKKNKTKMRMLNNFIDETSTTESKSLVVKIPCPINHYDGFQFVFPKDDTYRELVFCKDTRIYLQTFIDTLTKAK